MQTTIEVRDVPLHRLLVKRIACEHTQIGPSFGIAIGAVGKCFRGSDATMASMPMAVYLHWRDSDCDMAVGCQVEGNVRLTEGCEWLNVGGGTHACATHFGPYTTLHGTHQAIRNWCSEQGWQISGPCWETYPTDPGVEPDSSKWCTDVRYPIEAPSGMQT